MSRVLASYQDSLSAYRRWLFGSARSINGGFATLRSILPETTAADSKAAILQKGEPATRSVPIPSWLPQLTPMWTWFQR